VQFGIHSRYPFAQSRGAYRYPFNYPYYRYSPRHYPFGDGPYGPYGSNYGGYSGNAYDPGVYRSRPYFNAPQQFPDAPPAPYAPPPPGAPPQAMVVRPPAAAPLPPPQPADVVPPPRPRQVEEAEAEEAAASSVHARPLPDATQAYGEPVPYSGGSPFNPSYGGGKFYRYYPSGYFLNDMWFGSNRAIQGFGYYPLQNYSYFYGPPSGFGFYGPEYAPQYYNYSVRNFGPYYPGLGGVNNGSAFYQGW
jgi:hypothetical protein